MDIYFDDNHYLVINGLVVTEDLSLDDIQDDSWEVWDFANLLARRLVCRFKNCRVIIVLNFSLFNKKILYWAIGNSDPVVKSSKKKLQIWAKQTFDLSLPIKGKWGKIVNNHDTHYSEYDILCVFKALDKYDAEVAEKIYNKKS